MALIAGFSKEFVRASTGRLNNGVAQVPSLKAPSELDAFRKTLPVHRMKHEITRTINGNSVMMIAGETGSGKTTQVSDDDRRRDWLRQNHTG